MKKSDIKVLNRLRDQAQRVDPARVAEYRAMWSDLWRNWRPELGVDDDVINTDVRAMVLAFCRDGVPVETAKMITLEWLGGLRK